MNYEEIVVSSMERSNGDYVRLEENSGQGETPAESVPNQSWKRFVMWASLCVLLMILVLLFIIWVGPLFTKKVIVPIIKWEVETFSPPSLAMVIFASLAIFPVVLLPSTPSMWMAGMVFGYGIGFPLVMAGVTVGISLPYFIGSLFQSRANEYLKKYPKEASILRVAAEGNWIHQFRAVSLIRISPFPYPIFNYAVVATDIVYSAYFLGSLVGVVPDVLIALYSLLGHIYFAVGFLSAPLQMQHKIQNPIRHCI
ncbi:TVP38/TMEM64 family membrane protein YtxB-like isoform X2 [Mangifera indica]|uniref:TVP38/TMEM64 family membrane protein YtxB-like isoform X2 n=1 Tax=Mangifera indica TaxID=29780 RepID=UPI001CFA7C7D|nr:TVP38/TMEM64 family membrane protein YtxB-like isoform X2 [Mangifera indica]